MKLTVFVLLLAILVGAVTQAEDEKTDNVTQEASRIEVSQLTPEFDGTEVVIQFRVEKTVWLSGSVPAGQARSFLIETGKRKSEQPFSVLVFGEIADAMERFRYAPPQHGDPARGLVIEARGKIKVFPPPKSAPKNGPSYQFQISDLGGFQITSRPKRSDGITKR